MKMARRRPKALSLMLFVLAACLQFDTILALTPSTNRLATQSAARRVAQPAAGDLAFTDFDVYMLVRAYGTAYSFYKSIDTGTNLPTHLRYLAPTLASADKLRRERRRQDEAIAAYRSFTDGHIDTARLGRSYFGQALV